MLYQGIAPVKLREGDYVLNISSDKDRVNAIAIMIANGCKSTRFIKIIDGTLRCHGYLQEGLIFPDDEEVQ